MLDGDHDTASLFVLRACEDCDWDESTKINYAMNTAMAGLDVTVNCLQDQNV